VTSGPHTHSLHIELEEGKKWFCQDAAIFCPFVASLEKENAWGDLLLFLLSKNIPCNFVNIRL
jgi:hypothetical protein